MYTQVGDYGANYPGCGLEECGARSGPQAASESDDSRRSSLDSIDEDYPAAAREPGATMREAARREAALRVSEAAI